MVAFDCIAAAKRPLPIAAAFLVALLVTIGLTRFDGGVAFLWPASAILFAKLCATPRRYWRGIVAACVVASLIATSTVGFGWRWAVPFAVANVGEGLVAAWLVKRLFPRFGRLHSLGEMLRFLAAACAVVPTTIALLGAACVHMASGKPFWPLWADWSLAHALGMATFGPPLVLLFRGEVATWLRNADQRPRGETLILGALVALACVAAFGQSRVPLVIVPLVPIMIATFRQGRFGAVLSLLLLVLIGTGFTMANSGPTMLLPLAKGQRLEMLELYFAGVALIVLPAAAELKARKRMFERLSAAEALHRLVLDRTSDVIMRTGTDGTVRYVSPSVLPVTGRRPDSLLGRRLADLVHGDDAPALAEAIEAALAAPSETIVVMFRGGSEQNSAHTYEAHMRAALAEDGEPTGVVAIMRDMTRQLEEASALERRASTDPLTGLANRDALDRGLAALRRDGGPPPTGTIALFDLDHFKRINDSHGHLVGDEVLKRFAGLLRATVRDSDLVARFGGEEFVVMLPAIDPEQARLICERVRARLAALELEDELGRPVRPTVSVGLAAIDRYASDAEAIAAADAALYAAKRAGRNRLSLAA